MPHGSDYELQLAQRVASWADDADLAQLDTDRLREITAGHGVDFATRLLWERVRDSHRHGPFMTQVDRLRRDQPVPRSMHGVTFAIAPGAFYRELPRIDSDGRLLRAIAENYGCRSELIPVPSTASLPHNATCIIDWLLGQPPGPIILTSLSKGGADVRLALARPEAEQAFRHVVAWINICGMVQGTPLVPNLLMRPLRSWLVRGFFRWRGLDFQMVRHLQPAAPLWSEPLKLPGHIRLVSVVGFPLEHQMTTRRMRMWRRKLDPLGPNDGGVLLADVLALPGRVYPVWGSDHYLRPDLAGTDQIAAAILQLLGTELDLFDDRTSDAPSHVEAVS